MQPKAVMVALFALIASTSAAPVIYKSRAAPSVALELPQPETVDRRGAPDVRVEATVPHTVNGRGVSSSKIATQVPRIT